MRMLVETLEGEINDSWNILTVTIRNGVDKIKYYPMN